MFWRPIRPFRYIFLGPNVFSTALLKTFHHLLEVALLSSCLGFLTRISTLLSLISAVVLVGYANSIVRPYHTENLMIFVFFWLAFSHCGDALSIDRWIDRRFFSGNMIERKIRARSLKGEYSWPIWFVRIQMTLIFCSAGMSKLRASGLDWVLSGHLSNLMIMRYFLPERALHWEKLPLWLSQYKWAMKALAGTTVLFEISAPLALVSTRARAIIIPGLFAMMSGFWALMGIPFPELLICSLFWLPLDAGWFARFIPKATPDSVLSAPHE